MSLVEVRDLSIDYLTGGSPIHALRDATMSAGTGEIVGIVGESGCGKSTLAAALITLPAPNARVAGGTLALAGQDVLHLAEPQKNALRGSRVAAIFQDPMTSFNPVLTIGHQLSDVQHRKGLSAAARAAKAEAMLAEVGIPDPRAILGRYIHELSGGMRQRVAISAALLTDAEILVADEPTTALDVTMEAQIIHLLRGLRDRREGAIIVITHHLGLIGELCDRVYVMYAGEVVEEGPVDAIYHDPRHPYTAALIACDPANAAPGAGVLPTIPGRPPDLAAPPPGCAFAERCGLARDRCRKAAPPWVALGASRGARCHEVAA
jgi:oligopeptide/dipeptide ABC transporter ATP-binding protein